MVTTLFGVIIEPFFMVLYRTFMENGSIKHLSQSQRFFVEPYSFLILV